MLLRFMKQRALSHKVKNLSLTATGKTFLIQFYSSSKIQKFFDESSFYGSPVTICLDENLLNAHFHS